MKTFEPNNKKIGSRYEDRGCIGIGTSGLARRIFLGFRCGQACDLWASSQWKPSLTGSAAIQTAVAMTINVASANLPHTQIVWPKSKFPHR